MFSTFISPGMTPAERLKAAQALARRKSVLDFVNRDCAALKSALGAADARRLDDHCTTLRSIEQRVQTMMPPDQSSCVKPVDPGPGDWANPEQVDEKMSAFNELIAMTLACELTHVVAFQLGSQAARNRIASSYGVPSSPVADSGDSGPAHHPWTHQPMTDPNMNAAMRIFTTFYSNQVAALIDRLKATRDASGKPLLDSTVVLWLSELGGVEGNTDAHLTSMVPAVLIGRGQGFFNVGRYLRGSSAVNAAAEAEGGREMARLLVSVIQYMGLYDVNSVGLTGVTGPWPALLA